MKYDLAHIPWRGPSRVGIELLYCTRSKLTEVDGKWERGTRKHAPLLHPLSVSVPVSLSLFVCVAMDKVESLFNYSPNARSYSFSCWLRATTHQPHLPSSSSSCGGLECGLGSGIFKMENFLAVLPMPLLFFDILVPLLVIIPCLFFCSASWALVCLPQPRVLRYPLSWWCGWGSDRISRKRMSGSGCHIPQFVHVLAKGIKWHYPNSRKFLPISIYSLETEEWCWVS